MPCKDCVSGFVHSGTPRGNEQKIHGFDTYVASPLGGVPPKAIIVIIPDSFGWTFPNIRVIADNFAEKGQFLVYLPHIMATGMSPM
jgi:dienelactone hydrolase